MAKKKARNTSVVDKASCENAPKPTAEEVDDWVDAHSDQNPSAPATDDASASHKRDALAEGGAHATATTSGESSAAEQKSPAAQASSNVMSPTQEQSEPLETHAAGQTPGCVSSSPVLVSEPTAGSQATTSPTDHEPHAQCGEKGPSASAEQSVMPSPQENIKDTAVAPGSSDRDSPTDEKAEPATEAPSSLPEKPTSVEEPSSVTNGTAVPPEAAAPEQAPKDVSPAVPAGVSDAASTKDAKVAHGQTVQSQAATASNQPAVTAAPVDSMSSATATATAALPEQEDVAKAVTIDSPAGMEEGGSEAAVKGTDEAQDDTPQSDRALASTPAGAWGWGAGWMHVPKILKDVAAGAANDIRELTDTFQAVLAEVAAAGPESASPGLDAADGATVGRVGRFSGDGGTSFQREMVPRAGSARAVSEGGAAQVTLSGGTSRTAVGGTQVLQEGPGGEEEVPLLVQEGDEEEEEDGGDGGAAAEDGVPEAAEEKEGVQEGKAKEEEAEEEELDNDTKLSQGLRAMDEQVEQLASGAAKALSSLWGGLNVVAQGGWSLAAKVDAAATRVARELASVEVQPTDALRRLAHEAEARLQLVGKSAMSLLEDATGQYAGVGRAPQESHEPITFEDFFYVYGGAQLCEELEALSNESARMVNKSRSRLEASQQEQLDALMERLAPIFADVLQAVAVQHAARSGGGAAPAVAAGDEQPAGEIPATAAGDERPAGEVPATAAATPPATASPQDHAAGDQSSVSEGVVGEGVKVSVVVAGEGVKVSVEAAKEGIKVSKEAVAAGVGAEESQTEVVAAGGDAGGSGAKEDQTAGGVPESVEDKLRERYAPVAYLREDCLAKAVQFVKLLDNVVTSHKSDAEQQPPPAVTPPSEMSLGKADAGEAAPREAEAKEEEAAVKHDADTPTLMSTLTLDPAPQQPTDVVEAAEGEPAVVAAVVSETASGGVGQAGEGPEEDQEKVDQAGGAAAEEEEELSEGALALSALRSAKGQVAKRLAEMCAAQMQLLLMMGHSLAAPARVGHMLEDGLEWPLGAMVQALLLRGEADRMVADLRSVVAAYTGVLEGACHAQDGGVAMSVTAPSGDAGGAEAGAASPAAPAHPSLLPLWQQTVVSLRDEIQAEGSVAEARTHDGFRSLLYVVVLRCIVTDIAE